MTKEEGVRKHYQAVRDYDAAKSEKQRYQIKADEWSGSRSSYIRQRDAKEGEIHKAKQIIEELKAGKIVVQRLFDKQYQHNAGISAVASGLEASVHANDVATPDVEGALSVDECAQMLQNYEIDIRNYENNVNDLEREKRNLNTNIENCDRQIRSYSNLVDEAARNMRTYSRVQDEYRKYLYI